jgi:hypothetical protein
MELFRWKSKVVVTINIFEIHSYLGTQIYTYTLKSHWMEWLKFILIVLTSVMDQNE